MLQLPKRDQSLSQAINITSLLAQPQPKPLHKSIFWAVLVLVGRAVGPVWSVLEERYEVNPSG